MKNDNPERHSQMKDKQPTLNEEVVYVRSRCPVEIRDKIKRIAQEEDRILGQQVVKCLRDWLRSQSPGGSPSGSGGGEARGH